MERLTRALHFTTGAKAISIMFVAGIIALLIVRTPMHMAEEAMVPIAVAGESSSARVGALASTQPHRGIDFAAGATQQAEDARVPAVPVYLPSRLKLPASAPIPAPVPIYLQSEIKLDAPDAEPIATF
jgi:hypothetical protein